MRRRTLHLTGLVAAGVLVLGACGGGSTNPGAGTAVPERGTAAPGISPITSAVANQPASPAVPASSPAPSVPSPLPEVTVLDAATGGDVALASLLPADRPLLIWFWAPH